MIIIKKKSIDYIFIAFVIFLIGSLLIIISPILVKSILVKDLVNIYLSNLGSFKSEYLNLIGGMVGSGLAVTSAIWIQSKSEKLRKDDIELKNVEQRRVKLKIIINYIERELQMLWGLWIWARYDNKYWEKDRFPFEPYTVDNSFMLNIFVELDLQLEEKLVELFYDLYYFSEKINQYIKQYNSMNYEMMYISTYPCNDYNVSIDTIYRPNKNLKSMGDLIAYEIKRKKDRYFFDNESEFNEWTEIIKDLKDLEGEYIRKKHELDGKLDIEMAVNSSKNRASTITKGWIEDENSEIPKGYRDEVLVLREINNQIGIKIGKYWSTKDKYIDMLESPSISQLMKDLLEKLQ